MLHIPQNSERTGVFLPKTCTLEVSIKAEFFVNVYTCTHEVDLVDYG